MSVIYPLSTILYYSQAKKVKNKAISIVNFEQVIVDWEHALVIPVYNGTETISFLGPKLWNVIPSEIKGKESLKALKCVIKDGDQKIVHADCVNVISL